MPVFTKEEQDDITAAWLGEAYQVPEPPADWARQLWNYRPEEPEAQSERVEVTTMDSPRRVFVVVWP